MGPRRRRRRDEHRPRRAAPAADKSKTHGINGTRPTTHLRVDDIDQRYAALSKVALFAPERTHWGTRWFVARDPDGNLIAFEQPEQP